MFFVNKSKHKKKFIYESQITIAFVSTPMFGWWKNKVGKKNDFWENESREYAS